MGLTITPISASGSGVDYITASVSVALTATGTTTIYTVPTGKTFFLAMATAITTAFATSNATKATFIIEDGSANSITSSQTFAAGQEVVGKGKAGTGSGPATAQSVPAGGIVRVNVTTASLAGTHTAAITIFGYLY